MRRAILTEKRFGFTKEMIVADYEPIIRIPIIKKITFDKIGLSELIEPISFIEFEFVYKNNNTESYHYVEKDE